MRGGPLEFLACFAGKEHESVVRLLADPMHVYLALGLAGLAPGAPPRWDEGEQAYRAPTGALVDISVEWADPNDGLQVADGFSWLADVEFGQPPVARPWVFGGSVRVEDGSLAASRSGAGVALVWQSDSLLSHPREHSDVNAELWCRARTSAIPERDTPVTVVFTAAKVRTYDVRLTRRGLLLVNDRVTSVADLVNLVETARRVDAAFVQTVALERALQADVRPLRAALAELERRGAVRFVGAEDG